MHIHLTKRSVDAIEQYKRIEMEELYSPMEKRGHKKELYNWL